MLKFIGLISIRFIVAKANGASIICHVLSDTSDITNIKVTIPRAENDAVDGLVALSKQYGRKRVMYPSLAFTPPSSMSNHRHTVRVTFCPPSYPTDFNLVNLDPTIVRELRLLNPRAKGQGSVGQGLQLVASSTLPMSTVTYAPTASR